MVISTANVFSCLGINICGPDSSTRHIHALEECRKKEWADAYRVHETIRNNNETFTLGYEEISEFHHGLNYFLGNPKKLLFEVI